MPTYRLTYFDFDGGRAEPVRIAFHAAGIAFEYVRWAFPEFAEKRRNTPFSCVPVLEKTQPDDQFPRCGHGAPWCAEDVFATVVSTIINQD